PIVRERTRPAPRCTRTINARRREGGHPLRLCHRSIEETAYTGSISKRSQICRKDCHQRRLIAKRRRSAGREPCSHEDENVSDAIRDLVIELSERRRPPRPDRHHTVEKVREKTKLDEQACQPKQHAGADDRRRAGFDETQRG